MTLDVKLDAAESMRLWNGDESWINDLADRLAETSGGEVQIYDVEGYLVGAAEPEPNDGTEALRVA